MDIVTAYGLYDVVVPPYNLDELAWFYENSFANHAAINAKVSNIVGLGISSLLYSCTARKTYFELMFSVVTWEETI